MCSRGGMQYRTSPQGVGRELTSAGVNRKLKVALPDPTDYGLWKTETVLQTGLPV